MSAWAKGGIALLLGLVVVLPLGLSLAREHRFESSIEIRSGENRAGRSTAQGLAADVDRQLRTRYVRRTTLRLVGYPFAEESVDENVRVATADSPDAVRLVATSPSPTRAQELATVVARVIVGRTETASAPKATMPVDKIVDRLPGDLPPAPHPLWSGFAGLVLALVLLAVWSLSAGGAAGRDGGITAPGRASGDARASVE
jgi:hypothetical protein